MDFEQCPAIAPFFGFVGVACSCIFASKFGTLLCLLAVSATFAPMASVCTFAWK